MPRRAPKILVYNLWPELTQYFTKKFGKLSPTIVTKKLTVKTLDPQTEMLVVFIETPVTKEVIAKLPKLRYITTMSTGFDHIDMAAAKARGITVSNVPTYGENTVAEHTFALILGLTRKLFESVKRVKEGCYDFHGLKGVDLQGKTLGVIGTGHIGANVIRMAKGFSMEIMAYDAFPKPALAKKLGFTYGTLAQVLAESDIITLHAPLLPSTHHLINLKNIKKVKRGAYLINTARGALIDPEALVWALDNNHIAGAGLDVLEDENLIQHHEEIMKSKACQIRTSLMNAFIIDHKNTIVTPHNAFNSLEALQRIIDMTAHNVETFIAGKPENIIK